MTTSTRTAAASYSLVARIVDDQGSLDVEHTWLSNGSTGYRHTSASCKRLPKRRSTVYHRMSLREASAERLCPDCLLPGIADWLGLQHATALPSIVDDVANAEDMLVQLELPAATLSTFMLAETAGALEERLKGRALRALPLEGSLLAIAQRLSSARLDALRAVKAGTSELLAPIAAAALRPRQRSVIPETFATPEEMSVLGDVRPGTAVQHTQTGALLNLWIESVQRGVPLATRRADALNWVAQLQLESLAQLDHIPSTKSSAGTSARAAAEGAWRLYLPVLGARLLDRWESLLTERMHEQRDTLVAYYSRLHPSDPAMRAALLLFDTGVTSEGKRLLLVSPSVASWISAHAPERGSYSPTCYVESLPASVQTPSVLDTALALWDPGSNYSSYRTFAAAMGAAQALS